MLAGSSVPRIIKSRGKPVPVGLGLVAAYGVVVFGAAYRAKAGL